VQAEKIVDVVTFLRDDPGCRFVSFIDVTAVDYPAAKSASTWSITWLSPTLNERIARARRSRRDEQVPSIIEVFPGATGSSARPTISMA